jgi:hypothetical protein
MKYNLVQIRSHIKNQLRVSFEEIEIEGEVIEISSPMNTGFYYCLAKRGKKYAFDRLKKHLIKMYDKEITKITKELDMLKAVEYPHRKIRH